MPSPQNCSECWASPCRCNGMHLPRPPLPQPSFPTRPPPPTKPSSSTTTTSFYSLTSLHSPSLTSKLLSTTTAILTLGLHKPKPTPHNTKLTPLTRWRTRRQSVKELRKEEAAVHEEYRKMRELDQRLMGVKPPSYGVVVGVSREEVVGMRTRTSSASAVSGMGSENGSQRAESAR
ncbi:hypothetical protein BKA65DRAFT_292144 [Rhexocercosporidium sp. MPI-PUGE-AT-0058]|nr:hypothetical protein BKA65DRAFT_292144 [Rhexocercosporidium sp. MPI-PUGE-AT-0058]